MINLSRRNLKLTFFICTLLCIATCNAASHTQSLDNYLSKPTGQYGVGFKDFDWINNDICPAPNFNGKNHDNFSQENKKHCQEILVRIYYPTVTRNQRRGDLYYRPFIQAHQDNFRKNIPGITEKQLEQFNKVTIFSVENAPIVLRKTFPVLLFSPGDGTPAQAYENTISELVSHGYIVVGINSPIISGDIALLNGQVVKSDSTSDMVEKKLFALKPENLIYVFNEIHRLHTSNPIFSAMDLQQIGGLGHSGGATAIANIAHVHPNWFKAVVTLDIIHADSAELLKKFDIPFMNIISAFNRKNLQNETHMPTPVISAFELGEKGYLVKLSPNDDNYNYSDHQNFSDVSTLQYLAAYKVYGAYLKKQGHELGFVGKGNGWEITHSINTYLVEFFDTFLKNKKNIAFKSCMPLSKNTLIKCGPGTFEVN